MRFYSKYWLIPLTIYGIPNLLSYWTFIQDGVITLENIPTKCNLDFSTSLICISMVFFTFLFTMFFAELGHRNFSNKVIAKPVPVMVGKVVFVIQLLQIIAVLLLDFGRVGGLLQSSNPLAILVSYLFSDAVFMFYYGHIRSTSFPVVNVVTMIISCLIRGWAGVWIMIFLVEAYAWRRFSVKKILTRLLFIASIGFAIHPVIDEIKNNVRGGITEEVSFEESAKRLVTRLQLATNVLLIAEESDFIHTAIQRDEILPFYVDNKIGNVLARAANENLEGMVSLQKFITIYYMISDFRKSRGSVSLEDIGWSSHVGIAGWLFVIDWYVIPIYLLCVALLVIFPYWIAARFVNSNSIIATLHTITILYVFHGWFTTQVTYIMGLFLYSIILFFCKKTSNIK